MFAQVLEEGFETVFPEATAGDGVGEDRATGHILQVGRGVPGLDDDEDAMDVRIERFSTGNFIEAAGDKLS